MSTNSERGSPRVPGTIRWRKSSYSNGQGDCVELAALGAARWRKSSYSNAEGNCVELAEAGTGIALRDSKNPEGPVLRFTTAEWMMLTAAVKTGRYDIA